MKTLLLCLALVSAPLLAEPPTKKEPVEPKEVFRPHLPMVPPGITLIGKKWRGLYFELEYFPNAEQQNFEPTMLWFGIHKKF